MVWDLALLAILVANILRSAQRGGRVVGVELASFLLTYAATFAFAPWLARLIGARALEPPPFLSLLSIAILYFALRRPVRMLFEWWLPAPPAWRSPLSDEARLSRQHGACLGLVRGGIVVIAIALVGSGFARMQSVGILQGLPAISESQAVQSSAVLIDVLVKRYTREAGPSTRQLVALTLNPDEARLSDFLKSSVAQRIRRSDEMIAFARNPEVRRRIEARQIPSVLTHPAFLRVLSLTVSELRNEETVVARL
jgi:uncharacterized membrane protein required for colicin V production